MIEVQLTQGYTMWASDGDAAEARGSKWHAGRVGRGRGVYAFRNVTRDGKKRPVSFHREILKAAPGQEVDHIHGVNPPGLKVVNNLRENLRIGSHHANTCGFHRPRTGKTSKYRGVAWHKSAKKWEASIMVKRKKIHLGLFVSEEDAARAYDTAARRILPSKFQLITIMNLPNRQQRLKFKIDTILCVQDTLRTFLLPSGGFGEPSSNAQLDDEVRTSAEATYIRSCNHLDNLLDSLKETDADKAADAAVLKVLKTQIQSNREQAETARSLRRPSLTMIPEIAKHPSTGHWVAFYGDPNGNACIIGIGETPNDAMLDFDREFCTRQKTEKPTQSESAQSSPAPEKKVRKPKQ